MVTTNLPFDEWTEVFDSERLTGALLDQLTHHIHILEMNGENYRLKRYKQRLRKKNVRVISINEPTDDTPEGQLMEGMLELVDQHHSDMTAVDVQRGTHNLAQRGFFVGAGPPIGMKRIKVPDVRGEKVTERNKLAPDENAWIIRRVFDLSLQGKTDGQIHRILRSEGLAMPSGKPWHPNRIHDILTNRHYEGTIVLGALPDGTGGTVCENAHEGIVTPAEFAEVSRLRKERRPKVTTHVTPEANTCFRNWEPASNAENPTPTVQA